MGASTVPFGPTTTEHYVTLMRDLMLKDVKSAVPQDDAAWTRIGAEAAGHDLSGRTIDAICGNIRAEVQDFEYPAAYFQADPAARHDTIAVFEIISPDA